jgi:hypothetical protein
LACALHAGVAMIMLFRKTTDDLKKKKAPIAYFVMHMSIGALRALLP